MAPPRGLRPLKQPLLPDYPDLMVLVHGETLSPTRAARWAQVDVKTMKRHAAAGNVATDATGKRIDVKSLALYMQTGVPQGVPQKQRGVAGTVRASARKANSKCP